MIGGLGPASLLTTYGQSSTIPANLKIVPVDVEIISLKEITIF